MRVGEETRTFCHPKSTRLTSAGQSVFGGSVKLSGIRPSFCLACLVTTAEFGGLVPGPEVDGIIYNGHLLKRSGPKWAGVGAHPIEYLLSTSRSRAAVNSWDGFDIVYELLDPSAVTV